MIARSVLVLTLLALTADARAETNSERSGWGGFGVGSWVRTKDASKTKIAGEKEKDELEETRSTLTALTETTLTLKKEKKTAGAWKDDGEETLPLHAKILPAEQEASDADAPLEPVTVEGKAYPCQKTRSLKDDVTTTRWTSADEGLLKEESKSKRGTSSLTVTALAKKMKIGGQDITCRETRVVSKQTTSGDTTIVTLHSSGVPGGVVRVEMDAKTDAMTMHSVFEVVGFEKK